MYIPFEQVTIKLFHELVARGYSHYVLQRFAWPGVASGKGFLISPYATALEAAEHAATLDAKEGRALQLPDDAFKITDLLQPGSGYRIFLNKFSAADCDKRMLKHYQRNIVNYLHCKRSIIETRLFSHRNQRHDALMEVLNKINKQYAQNTVRLGAQDKGM